MEKVSQNAKRHQITLELLTEKVQAMRQSQRRYARTGKECINESRIKLEQEVDDLIGKLTDTQKSLW